MIQIVGWSMVQQKQNPTDATEGENAQVSIDKLYERLSSPPLMHLRMI